MRFNKLIPELTVLDLGASIHFYTVFLEFKMEYNRPETKFAFLSKEGSQIMIQQGKEKWKVGRLERPYGRGVNLQIEVARVKPLLRVLHKHKYALFSKLEDH